MSLRPRYSLLTLLVLTALVAGGVKLWRGPHRVVERNAKGDEEEYTYTRNWQGSRIIQGIKVERTCLDDGIFHLIEIQYYENGIATPRVCFIEPFPHRDSKSGLYWQWDDKEFADISEFERGEWKFAIHRERGRVLMLPHYVHVWTSN